MKKIFKLHEGVNMWGEVRYQELYDEDGDVFSCGNLAPEDAIIGRGIFSVNDFVETVKYGMKLAKEGYDDIEIEHEESGEEQE